MGFHGTKINEHYVALSAKKLSTIRAYDPPRQNADFGRLALLPLPESVVGYIPRRYDLHAAYYIGDDEVVEDVSALDHFAFEEWRESEADRDDFDF